MSFQTPPFWRRMLRGSISEEQTTSTLPRVDVHAHILPNVDDGAKNWDMSLAMCAQAQPDGTTHIVATPHANEHWVYDREQHETSLALLREQCPGLEFTLGCDLNCSFDNVEAVMSHPRRYAIGSTRYLLVEFNHYSTRTQIREVLKSFQSAGLFSLFTHPERLPLVMEDPSLAKEFADAGALIQVTANALTGGWGSRVRRVAERLLKQRLLAVVASDAHDTERRRPTLSEAHAVVSQLLSSAEADWLFSRNPQAIVSDRPITNLVENNSYD